MNLRVSINTTLKKSLLDIIDTHTLRFFITNLKKGILRISESVKKKIKHIK